MKKIKVFIVDDHSIVLEGIKSLIEENDSLLVNGFACNGHEALDKIRHMEFKPHVVLMDINMPEMDGIECTRALSAEFPESKVIILTMLENNFIIHRILEAGAVGYLMKSGSKQELYEAIHKVHSGDSYFTPRVSTWIVSQMTRLRGSEPTEDFNLSAREKEVLSMIVKDASNQEIASALGISVRTVESHKLNLIAKTRVRSVAGLVVKALDSGLLM